MGGRSAIWSGYAIALVRWLFGLDYVINGLNWFHKIITPYPSLSDFVDFRPPPDIVGAMIDNGALFTLAKATELVTGAALLANRFVPLALVLAMTVTVPVFIVDTLRPQPHLRAAVMGTAALSMNVYLAAAYFAHYRTLLVARSSAHGDPRLAGGAEAGAGVRRFASVLAPLMPALGTLSALLGVVAVIWLAVMIGQYVAHPLPLTAVHPLQPR